jgi:hypothetical protein
MPNKSHKRVAHKKRKSPKPTLKKTARKLLESLWHHVVELPEKEQREVLKAARKAVTRTIKRHTKRRSQKRSR